MIELNRLSKMYGRSVAVDALEASIPRGKVVGFLGPNGAGKSTTIRMLAGYLAPTAGTATVDGFDVRTAVRDVRRRIGYLPESTPLYGEMRVREYLALRARLFEIPRSQRRAAIDLAMQRCWLTDVQRKPIRHLSKGFRQRVGLAAALVHEPPVLLLDEPTSGLDPTQILEVRGLIRELAGTHTILLSTHILPEVEVTCDRVILIAGGRIRAEGTLDDVRAGHASDPVFIVEGRGRSIEAQLRAINGVKHIGRELLDDDWQRFRISATSGRDLREPIARALTGEGIMVRELHRVTPSLEEIFIRLTSDTPMTSNGNSHDTGEEA